MGKSGPEEYEVADGAGAKVYVVELDVFQVLWQGGTEGEEMVGLQVHISEMESAEVGSSRKEDTERGHVFVGTPVMKDIYVSYMGRDIRRGLEQGVENIYGRRRPEKDSPEAMVPDGRGPS